MSRYIDADAFENELKKIEAITAMANKELGEDDEAGEISMPMFTIRNIMRKCAPIDIVRCGECKYWKESQYYSEVMACTYVKGATFTRQHDDFCSRGERRTDDRV